MATTIVPSYGGQGGNWTLIHPDDVTITTTMVSPTQQLLNISLTYDQSDFLDNSLNAVDIQFKEPEGNGNSGLSGGIRTALQLNVTNGLGTDTLAGGTEWTGFDITLAPASGPRDAQALHSGYAHFHNVTAANFPNLAVSMTGPSGLPTTEQPVGTDASGNPIFATPANIHLDGAIPFGSAHTWGTAGDPDLVLHRSTYADQDDGFFMLLSPHVSDADRAKLLPSEGPDNLLGGAEGDHIALLGGDDIADGRGGNDTLEGGPGNDRLMGGPGLDRLDGGAGDDILESGPGDFETLIGGAGSDTADYSAYTEPVLVDLANGTVRFIDTSFFPVDKQMYGLETLTDIENAWTGSHNDTLTGSAAANRFSAGAGNDLLIGGAGDDTLDGGPGADRMEGGPGTDTYHVDDPGDVVVELQNSGFPDTVISTVSFALPEFVDNLELAGTGAIDGIGNDAPNRITAALGNNTLTGRGGADEFRFFSATGSDRIADFTPGEDHIHIVSPSVAGMSDLRIGEQAGNAVVSWSIDGIASSVTLSGVAAATLTANDFLFG